MVVNADFATCGDLPWMSWTSLCLANDALEFLTLKKKNIKISTQVFFPQLEHPNNFFVGMFSICHLKGNMIFVPLALNIKWI